MADFIYELAKKAMMDHSRIDWNKSHELTVKVVFEDGIEHPVATYVKPRAWNQYGMNVPDTRVVYNGESWVPARN